ncbi:MAG: ATP-dependent RecD-like DNA helicase [Bacilli bacterium]|nr:ATP-dependent RecD-like DNA helicase [Bacilli bacterium]
MNGIKGIFKKIIFKSDNNYIIGLFRVKDTDLDEMLDFVNKTITITGYFHELSVDESYIMHGSLVENPRYGLQFNVTDYDRITPEDKDGIIDFLASGLFPGVGEKSASSIVETLGDDALKLIEEDYSNLLLVPKMTNKKAKEIHEILTKYNESYNTIVYLNNIGFSTKDSLTIYNYYKNDTYNKVSTNIYSITDDLKEISFMKIEKVRKSLEIEDSNKNRIMYMILYVMNNLCFSRGDTYLELIDIYEGINKIINFDFTIEELEYYLYELQKKNKIIMEDKKIFLTEYYQAEVNISERMYYLTNKKDTKYKNINNEIESVELYFDIKYNDDQRKAIKNSIVKNINIITGGPGVGKTTIIKGIVETYKKIHKLNYMDMQNKMALLAPTGRAAKRMGEAALMPALTIHRFLKWNRETDKFMVNEQNKSDVDFVIIDEVSMVDTLLLDNLLKGLKKDVKIVMIGDYNQLESVSPGKVLKDLIDSDIINTIKLTELYRQKENSYISILAKEIKENDIDIDFNIKKDDFNFYETDNSNIKNYITKLCAKAIEKGYDVSDIQVLAPMYKGENGIDNLNKLLQNIFNPDLGGPKIKSGDVEYRINDKILQLENDPDNNVFNGDIGYVIDIEDNTLYIDFYGNIVKYTPKNFNVIKHGYAISIHKSQGSEFKLVFIPISFNYRIMLYKKLIYTAVTRARDSLALIGSKEAFLYSINNDNTYERRTYLKELLLQCIK